MRIILPKEQIKGQRITLSGEKARYLISVLRCSAGDELQVFDGEGSLYKSKITGIENKKVIIDLLEKVSLNAESPLNLTLVQGILKGEKMDVVVQKATELGVKEIIPAITERSQIRHTRKVDRWRKIAEEASRQSGRTIVPVVHKPIEYRNALCVMCDEYKKFLLTHHDLPITDYGLRGFIFWEDGGLSLKEAIKQSAVSIQHSENSQLSTLNSQLFVLVGPEGGFSKEEVSRAVSKGLIAVSLGKRILRAETAAISAVALIQFLLGDMSG